MPFQNRFSRSLPGLYVLAGLVVITIMSYIGLHDYLSSGWLFVGLFLIGNGMHLHRLGQASAAEAELSVANDSSACDLPGDSDWSTETAVL